MNEDAITGKLRRRWPLIGDDCAVIRPPANQDLLFTTDFSTEGVHFTRKSSAEEIGYRALARSLSDIAAMGGTPLFCLVSLALAPWTDQRWIDRFYLGVNKLLRKTRTALAGGDISHANQVVCDVMVCGSLAKGKALLRSGAKPGDAIYVSGPLGGWRHKRVIVPRLDVGRKLIGKATACMDISDGLALDLHRLCLASGVAADLDNIPLLQGATLKQALHDGEDYELVYTAPPKIRVPGQRIGTITKGKPGAVRYCGKALPPIGYDHTKHRP
ncbi:MAG TPA: thiamine-phosphate kinase [Bryobacteraceae bacterium]|nr:thiamine-phosphate kinase [Bryobacteraceae bacterium]